MGKRTLAFYIRLSDADEEVKKGIRDESNSIMGQRELLTSFVRNSREFDRFDIIEYFDDGFSGTKFMNREQFQKMIADAKAGRFECLIVKDFSRLGRDYLEVGNYMEFVFPVIGLRFISVNDNYDSDKNCGMTGGMDVAFKNLIYQMYSMDLSRKVKSARRNRNRNGECTASFVKYGYRKDPQDRHRLIIDEDVAPYVKEIFEKVASGMTTGEIARQFNQRKVPTRLMSQRGKSNYVPYHDKGDDLWSDDAVLVIIRDEGYTGKLIQNKSERYGFGEYKKQVKLGRSEWSVVEDGMPAIVSRQLFDTANAKIPYKNMPKRERKHINLFICPYCGRSLKCGRENGYYKCDVGTMDRSKPCKNIRMKKKDAEDIVLESVRVLCVTHLEKADVDKGDITASEDIPSQINLTKREMERLQDSIVAGYKAYQQGIMSREAYISARAETNDTIAGLEKELALLEERLKAEAGSDTDIDCDWTELLEQTFTGYDGEKFRNVIDRIYVYGDGRVEIVFKGN